MYHRKIITEALKYAQTLAKSSYMVMNICLSHSKENVFRIKYSPQIRKIRKCYNHKFYEQRSSTRTKFLIASVSISLFNLFDTDTKEEIDDVENIKTTIKRSLLLIQKKEYEKAEQMLHIALRQAQTLQHSKAINYILVTMASLAYGVEDFKKAEKLYISVIQRLISDGAAQDDCAIIDMSLKLANMYSKMGDIEKAENGFKFCLENLQKHMAKDSENLEVLELFGLALEWYGTMLFSQSHYADALNYFTQAYDVSLKLNGKENEQTVILLNDLGTAYCMIKEYDQAVEHLSEAIEIGKKLPDMVEIGSFYVNLGNALIAKGLYAEAKKNCNHGRNLARIKSHDESLVEAEKCLERIRNLTA